jgi:hypothetical protein
MGTATEAQRTQRGTCKKGDEGIVGDEGMKEGRGEGVRG